MKIPPPPLDFFGFPDWMCRRWPHRRNRKVDSSLTFNLSRPLIIFIPRRFTWRNKKDHWSILSKVPFFPAQTSARHDKAPNAPEIQKKILLQVTGQSTITSLLAVERPCRDAGNLCKCLFIRFNSFFPLLVFGGFRLESTLAGNHLKFDFFFLPRIFFPFKSVHTQSRQHFGKARQNKVVNVRVEGVL